MKTTVVRCGQEPHDVYIGRPSKWGNPFAIGRGASTRAEAIAFYREWIKAQPGLLADIHELKGKRLGCYCKPKACHGDVLAALANEERDPL